jgi:hypothetical protein
VAVAARFFVSGSDHNNAKGWIAQIRGFDTVSATDGMLLQALIPERLFGDEGPNGERCNLLASYIGPATTLYPDLSDGYDCGAVVGRNVRHPGKPYASMVTSDYINGYFVAPPSSLPTPTYVTDAPFDPAYNQDDGTLLNALGRGYTPKAVPGSARLFDSFSRADQTYAHRLVPDLGSVEYCSFGAAPRWNSAYGNNAAPQVAAPGGVQKAAIGIFNRSPVPLDQYVTVAWVNNNSANMTVQATRRSHVGTSSDGKIGLAFRVQDGQHFWAVFYQRVPKGDGTLADDTFYLYRWDGAAGLGTFIAQASAASLGLTNTDWRVLKAVTSGNTINCFADSTNLFGAITNATYNTAVGAGMYFQQSGALGRIYDWTVL